MTSLVDITSTINHQARGKVDFKHLVWNILVHVTNEICICYTLHKNHTV